MSSNPPPSKSFSSLSGKFSYNALLRMRAAAETPTNAATQSTVTDSTTAAINTAATASTSRAPVSKAADARKVVISVEKPTESIPRKTREQLNTGNARPERRERLPITFDALETVAPLEPEVQTITAEFKHDEFIKGRQVPSAYLHGDRVKEIFDAENFDVLPDNARNNAYKERLRSERLGLDKGKLPELEKELDAAAKFAQPTVEQFEQWKRDINNPAFVKNIKANAIRSSSNLTEIQRAKQLNDPEVQKRRRDEIQRAFIANSKSLKENPDFYTGFSDYNYANAEAEKKRQQQQTDNDDDVDDKALNSTSSASDSQKTRIAAAVADERKTKLTSREEENMPVPISAEDARQLLHYEPLVRLQSVMHRDFMALPEINQTFAFLMALQMKPETYHRKHYNAQEFVRAMDRCGAKYDGSILLSTTARLRTLLHRGYYSLAFAADGEFIDKHEHYCQKGANSGKTVLAVFKFYCVLRNQENVSALSKYALDDDEHTNIMNTDLFDPASLLNQSQKYTRLDKPGLYDVDNTADADADDGVNPDGSMHSIKNLAKEFMFCLRVVCVVPTDDTTNRRDKEDDSIDSEIDEYASIEDGDFVLPEHPPSSQFPADDAAAAANGMAEDPTDCITVGPDDDFTVRSHHQNPAAGGDDDDGSGQSRAPLNVVERLQRSEFADNDDDEAAPALSSEPREVLVSDTTTGRGTNTRSSTAARREKSSASSNSELFGGDAGSKSDDDRDEEFGQNFDDDNENHYQSKRRAVQQQQRRYPFNSLYYNTERFGMRPEDVDDNGLLSQDDEMLERRFDERHPVQNPFAKPPQQFSAAVASGPSTTTTTTTNRYDVHTDDEKSKDDDDDDSSLNEFLPEKQLTIDRTQAKRAVGDWKAPDFEKKINRQYLTKLCVRAFAYYAVSLPITASAVGNKKKKKK